jgi:hypothetical protein
MTMDVELSFPLLLGCYFVSLREICFLSICLSVNDTLLRLHSLFCLQHTASSCFQPSADRSCRRAKTGMSNLGKARFFALLI